MSEPLIACRKSNFKSGLLLMNGKLAQPRANPPLRPAAVSVFDLLLLPQLPPLVAVAVAAVLAAAVVALALVVVVVVVAVVGVVAVDSRLLRADAVAEAEALSVALDGVRVVNALMFRLLFRESGEQYAVLITHLRCTYFEYMKSRRCCGLYQHN